MDLALRILPDGTYDLAESGNDALTDASLESAIITSLFADHRAEPPVDGEVKGHWTDNDDDRWGSAFWQLRRNQLTPHIAERLRAAAIESLQWIITDRIANSVDAEVSIAAPDTAKIVITVAREGVSDEYTFTAAFAASLPQ